MKRTDKLSQEQARAFDSLREFLHGPRLASPTSDGRFQGPLAAAVVGSRGSGKSTVLGEIERLIAAPADETGGPRIFVTRLLDAATVPEDLGLGAATLRRLYDCASRSSEEQSPWPPPSTSGPWSAAPETGALLGQELRRAYEDCVQQILVQEESYRALAQDLAMSPLHYSKMVLDSAYQREQIPAHLTRLLDGLERALPDSKPRPNRSERKSVVFTVLIDDLDLAPPSSLRRFLRALLADYRDARLRWVLGFDRAHLLDVLAGSQRESSDVALFRGDLTNAQALLSKVVPNHRQHELPRWNHARRLEFRPLAPTTLSAPQGREAPTLRALLQSRNLGELLPLLPSSLRGLEELHAWLDPLQVPQVDEGSSDGARQIQDYKASALVKMVRIAGADGLAARLEERGVEQFAVGLRFRRDSLPPHAWRALIASAHAEAPLAELPEPDGWDGQFEPLCTEAFLESVLTLALGSGRLDPSRLLRQLPFLEERLQRACCELTVPENDLRRYFTLTQGGAGGVTSALLWQEWAERVDTDGYWRARIGPLSFLEALDQQRSLEPALFRVLSLGSLAPIQRNGHANPTGPRPNTEKLGQWQLPKNFRALLRLVDGLDRAPWAELSNATNLWTPLAFTRCSAAFTLAALVPEPAAAAPSPPSENLLLRAAFDGVASDLLRCPEPALRSAFSEALAWFAQVSGLAGPSGEVARTPSAAAEWELSSSLSALSSLPWIQSLAGEGTE